jgi:protein-tyrosine phosphatase
MVCLGNICRSPLAEGILKSKLPNDNSFFVDSTGTGDYHIGKNPDSRSIAVAKKYGLDISNLKGRQFTISDFDVFDIIYAMDESNYRNIISLARNNQDKEKVKFILNEIYPDQNYNVPDPYYGGHDGFENVYKMLDEACTIIAKSLIETGHDND